MPPTLRLAHFSRCGAVARPLHDAGMQSEHIETLVIGAGQAGLSVGYHLARRGRRFLILDANQRIGDCVASPLGFITTLHTGPLGQPRWHALPGAVPLVSDQGSDGCLSRSLCRTFPSSGEKWGARRAVFGAEGQKVHRDHAQSHVHRRPRCRGDVQLSEAARSRIRVAELRPDIVQIHSRDYKNPSQLARR